MIVNTSSILQHVIQNKNGIMEYVNVNGKIIISTIKDYSWNPSKRVCESSKYLQSIAETSVTEPDGIVIVIDNLSTKRTSTNATKYYN